MDLLQPLLRSEDNIDEEVDLADLDNLKCNTNEFGALVVSTPGSNSSSQTTTNELEADDSDLDLICRETVQITPPKQPLAVVNNTSIKNETSNSNTTITASIGIACNKEETFAQFIQRADGALYKAKNMGRNQVIAA